MKTGTLISILVAISIAMPAFAQSPPTAAQIAGFDALHKSAHEGDLDGLRRLLSTGADPDARDPQGRTPAHVAAFASQAPALRVLAEAGADLTLLEQGRYDVLTIAAVANDVPMVALALELGNPPGLVTSIYDGTALIAAAHLGHHEVVRLLVEAGAPLDHVNNLGWTALIEAVVLGDGGPDHIKTVQILLDAGADPRLSDSAGITPLELAEARGYTEIARLIRAAGG